MEPTTLMKVQKLLCLRIKRSRIQQKLSEYEDRLAGYQADGRDNYEPPELGIGSIPNRQIGTVYKIAVARELLEKGEVDTYELSRRLSVEHGGFNVDRFNNACAVMQSYCEDRR